MTTTQTTDEGNVPLEQPATPAVAAPETPKFVEELDPMIEEAKKAEAEVAEAEAAKPTEGQPAVTGAQPKDPNAKPAMIPKARLDEVLSERDLLRDQVGYMRGVIDAQAGQRTAAAAPATTEAKTTPPAADPGKPVVDEIETAIAAAEAKKLELATQYDEGTISTRQWKEQELAIDKEIRALDNQRLEKVREDGKADIKSALSAQQIAETVNGTALNLQKAHPNVAVIDGLSEGVRDGVWKDITTDAARNLAAKGINVKDGTPATKLALIEEKARLTDNLEKYLPGMKPATQQPASGNAPGQKKPSEAALNRAAKIDLANSQPPSIADMGRGTDNAALTDHDIENMTEDQVADIIKKAPNLLKRLTG